MEARGSAIARLSRYPAWVNGLVPLVVLGIAIALFVGLGAPGLDRNGIPLEQISVERATLTPGKIELVVRNDGPDPVQIRQVTVNKAFAAFSQSDAQLGRLEGGKVTVTYPWVTGQAYSVDLISSTGQTVTHQIQTATETPQPDAGFFGLMALIGMYVGVIPVAIGMLWLPWVRSVSRRWIQFVLALTVGLLAFLGIDALLAGTKLAAGGAQAFGGSALVWLGAAVAYLALVGIDAAIKRRQAGVGESATKPWRLALLVAIGIGLHNLGEGLVIGSAYAIGSLALGASLIVGFALHNTTEGLAIVSPIADGETQSRGGRLSLGRLLGLGTVAGGPVILGAFIGASSLNPAVASFMFGLGAGAIAQVIVQIAPAIRDSTGRLLHPLAVGGLLGGLAVMYATGLLVSV